MMNILNKLETSHVLYGAFAIWAISFAIAHSPILVLAYLASHSLTMLFCYMMWSTEQYYSHNPVHRYPLEFQKIDDKYVKVLAKDEAGVEHETVVRVAQTGAFKND